MRHEFVVTEENEEKIKALINAAAAFTGGGAEIVMVKKVVTEDERIAGILDSLLNNGAKKPSNGNGNQKDGHSRQPAWTVVESGKRISHATLTQLLANREIEEGAQLFHETRGNYVVDLKDNGTLALKKVLA